MRGESEEGTHVQQNVGRVEVSVADSSICDVLHALRNSFQEAQNGMEAVRQLPR
jgi:hypothetical protein